MFRAAHPVIFRRLRVDCGAHHTSFSHAVTAEHLHDFAEMAGIEFLLIDEKTCLEDFKKELRWNDLYYHTAKGL